MRGAKAASGADKVPVDDLIIAADRKILTPAGLAETGQHPQHEVGPVKTDQLGVLQILKSLRASVAVEIVLRAVKRDGQVCQVAGDDIVLGRAVHAQGNIRLAEQQVFGGIGGDKFDLDAGLDFTQASQHGRQKIV